MMNLPGPGAVTVLAGKPTRRFSNRLPEMVEANREVRPPNDSGFSGFRQSANFGNVVVPTSRSNHSWDPQLNQAPKILPGRVRRRELDRNIRSFERLGCQRLCVR